MNNVALLQGRLDGYHCSGVDEEYNALREILQEVILAGLARTGFFAKAAFHGGTQLRIFEGVRRFSEDLDFALVAPDSAFALSPYLEGVATELASMGVEMEVRDKSKADNVVKKGLSGFSNCAMLDERGVQDNRRRFSSKWRLTPTRRWGRHILRLNCIFHFPSPSATSTEQAPSPGSCMRCCAGHTSKAEIGSTSSGMFPQV